VHGGADLVDGLLRVDERQVPQAGGSVAAAGREGAAVRAEATERTGPVWPVDVARSRPVAASHRRTVPSSLPLATVWPSGLKATAHTWSPWPVRTASCFPVVVSHSRTVRSSLLLARVRPSGPKASALTVLV